MYGILFRVVAKPGKFQELVDFMTWDAEVCRDEEPGTLRFEFYQDPENENGLYVYEAYQDLEAFAAHQKNEPYKHWDSVIKEEVVDNYRVLFRDEALFSPTD